MQLTHQHDVLSLTGDVTVTSITRDDYRLLEAACQQPIRAVDLSGVGKVDSSCVALLVAIKRHTNKQTWQLLAAPAAVTALLQLYELEWLT